jgi:hypothetical protein
LFGNFAEGSLARLQKPLWRCPTHFRLILRNPCGGVAILSKVVAKTLLASVALTSEVADSRARLQSLSGECAKAPKAMLQRLPMLHRVRLYLTLEDKQAFATPANNYVFRAFCASISQRTTNVVGILLCVLCDCPFCSPTVHVITNQSTRVQARPGQGEPNCISSLCGLCFLALRYEGCIGEAVSRLRRPVGQAFFLSRAAGHQGLPFLSLPLPLPLPLFSASSCCRRRPW